jgi:hypothetical protein
MEMKNQHTQNIKMVHEQFGTLLNENFVDKTQFKIFLKMIHSCLALKEDLDFFNGVDFLIHIPYKHLKDSIIYTHVDIYTMADHLRSKIEAEVTR